MEYKSGDRREQVDEYLHKIIIAAATTLAMACLKRVLLMFFIEQWRARVFIVLNLVLVAIVVTSIRFSSTGNEEMNSNNNAEDMVKNQEKRRKGCADSTQDHEEEKSDIIRREDEKEGLEKVDEQEQEESKKCNLSKEELNERVEAFIAMFRQHLVSDAKKGKINFISRTKQADMLNFHKFNSIGQLKSCTVPYRHSFCN